MGLFRPKHTLLSVARQLEVSLDQDAVALDEPAIPERRRMLCSLLLSWIGRFFLGPFRGRPVSGPLVSLVILALAVLLYGQSTMLELGAQNCLDADAIAGEMLKEAGPDYIVALKGHIAVLEHYVNHMKLRYLAAIPRLLVAENYDVESVFLPILAHLKDATNNKEAQQTISKAGQEISLFCESTRRKSRQLSVWYSMGSVTPELEKDLHNTTKESSQSTDILLREPNFTNAKNVYLVHRRMTLYLILIRATGSEPRLTKLLYEVKSAKECIDEMIRRNSEPERLEHLKLYSESEGRQVLLLEAMEKADVAEILNLLRNTLLM